MCVQIAAWDANLVTAHRRMGNTSLNLEDLGDGEFLIYKLLITCMIAEPVLKR